MKGNFFYQLYVIIYIVHIMKKSFDWRENDDIYNAAAFIHDGLYACKGEIQEKDVPKEKNESVRYTLARRECDNLLREIWIKSKFVDSLSAKIAEFGVNVVAKGPEHWDNDDLHCKEHFNVTIEYL